MERKFKLLKDLPFAKAGAVSIMESTIYKFSDDNRFYHRIFIDEIEACPDWFEEITQSEMVWQKPEAGDAVWFIDGIGRGANPHNYRPDMLDHANNTAFYSEKQCLQFIKYLKAGAILRAAIERVNVTNGNWKPDFLDGSQSKAYFILICGKEDVDIDFVDIEKFMPDCYYFCPSKQKQVLTELGQNATQIIKDFLMID